MRSAVGTIQRLMGSTAVCFRVLPTIGRVEFRGSPRYKRLRIVVDARGGVRVTYPARMPPALVAQFVTEKTPWIQKHVARQRQYQSHLCRLPLPGAARDEPSAIRHLAGRLQYLSERHALPYRGFSPSRARTRWGSCSAGHHIRLNIRLALLPDRLIDLVILHELLHTRIRGHGPDFYLALEKLLPGASTLDHELKTYGGILHADLDGKNQGGNE